MQHSQKQKTKITNKQKVEREENLLCDHKEQGQEIFPKRNLNEAKWLTTGQQQID